MGGGYPLEAVVGDVKGNLLSIMGLSDEYARAHKTSPSSRSCRLHQILSQCLTS